MGHRNKRQRRCARCRMPSGHCLCFALSEFWLGTKIVLVMHFREWRKPTATGPMALSALPHHELVFHGLAGSVTDLSHLHQEGRAVCALFPADDAIPLDRVGQHTAGRPVTLIVPDGNWSQARRMPKRIPGMREAIPVTLPKGQKTEWGLRRETRPDGLATFEAIARALGILESSVVQRELEAYFRLMVGTTFAIRHGDPLVHKQRPAHREP